MVDHYKAEVIANTILGKCFKKGIITTPMKLQSLLYYTVGFALLKHGKSPIREHFYKWTRGPSVPRIYKIFKTFRDRPIAYMSPDAYGKFYITKDENILGIIKKDVMPYYSDLTSWDLSFLAREHDAWKDVKKNEMITNESILSTFRKLQYGE